MPYKNATICLNGHVISHSKSNAENFCSQCGSKTYSSCPKCNTPIRGVYDVDGVAILGERYYEKPYYCHNCGAPYPWTQKILDNAVELLSLDDDLDSSSKELIKNAIPDLIVDTPTTPIAIKKYRKGLARAGEILKNSMRQLLIDVICEAAKKVLFP